METEAPLVNAATETHSALAAAFEGRKDVGGGGPPRNTLAGDLWGARSLIGGCMVLAAAAALIGSLFSPRQYEARVSIVAEPRKEANPLQIEVRSQLERQSFVNTQKELLVSRAVVAETLVELQRKPLDKIEPQEIEDFLQHVSIASRSGLGRNLFGGSGIGESNTFFVSVVMSDPNEAAKAANTLVNKYLEVARRIRNKLANEALTVLSGATEESSKRAVEAHARMSQLELAAGDLIPNLLDADKPTLPTMPELREIRTTFYQQQALLDQQRERINLLSRALETTGEVTMPNDLVVNNSAIGQLKSKLAELRVDAVKQAPFYSEQSRDVASLRQQIGLVEQLLQDEVRRVLEGEKQTLGAMEQAQAARTHVLAQYQERMTSLTMTNALYSDARRVYDGLAKAQQAQVEGMASAQVAAADRSAQAGIITILDGAVPDPRPVSPKTARNVVLASALGFMVGLLIALLRLPATAPAFAGRRLTD